MSGGYNPKASVIFMWRHVASKKRRDSATLPTGGRQKLFPIHGPRLSRKCIPVKYPCDWNSIGQADHNDIKGDRSSAILKGLEQLMAIGMIISCFCCAENAR